ncbi:MAG: CBS domain-containing protein [Planctomycetota bacterium]
MAPAENPAEPRVHVAPDVGPRVADIAVPPGPSLAADCVISEAATRLIEADCERAYLVDADGRPVGLVTAAAVLRSRCVGTAGDRPALSIACRCFGRVDAATPVAEVMPGFREDARERLAVLSVGRLVGVVRRLDVLRVALDGGGRPRPHRLRGPHWQASALSATER